MGVFQKLAAKTYEKYLDWLAWIIAGVVVGMTLSIIAVITDLIATIPSRLHYAFVGFVGAVVFILLIACLLRLLERVYRKRWLSARQRQLVYYLGNISSSGTEYQDVLRDLEVPEDDKHWVHIERRRLQALGLVHYEKGWVELTDSGNAIYDKLVERDKCDFEDSDQQLNNSN